MNLEFELKLQALLDGELPGREAAEVEARVKADPQAQALLDELRMTTTALRGNELERALPETREFFWSKIERAIAAWEKSAPASPDRPLLGWLFRYWPQMSGACAAAVLLTAGALHFHWVSGVRCDEIESGLADGSSFTYRSEQNRMTLVWVSSVAQPEQDDEFESVN
ncbi:MAG: hypothetical protein NTW03_19100 [Verrucomicrobia bacterium]|nr:hypothetical protein [Verrucomicrobiota bacterium]